MYNQNTTEKHNIKINQTITIKAKKRKKRKRKKDKLSTIWVALGGRRVVAAKRKA